MDLAALVPLADVGQDLGLGERSRGVSDEPLLVGQGEVDHGARGPLLRSPPILPPPAAASPDRDTGPDGRRPPYTRPMSTTDDPALDLAALARPQHLAGHRPLHGPQLVPRRGPPPVRHGGARVPRLRQRDRRHHARPRPSAGDRRRPRAGRPAHGPGRTRWASPSPRSSLAADARRHVPGPARLGAVPELGLRDRSTAPSSSPGGSPAGPGSSPSAARSTGGRSGRRA